MIKFAIALFFVTRVCCAVDIYTVLSDTEMEQRYPIVFEGVITEVKKGAAVWEISNGEKKLSTTEYNVSIMVGEEIKHSLDYEEVTLTCIALAIRNGRVISSYDHLRAGQFCRVYAEEAVLKESGIAEIKIKSPGEIRLGTVEERIAEAARVDKLRKEPFLNSIDDEKGNEHSVNITEGTESNKAVEPQNNNDRSKVVIYLVIGVLIVILVLVSWLKSRKII